MKKILAILLFLVVLFSFTACGKQIENEEETQITDTITADVGNVSSHVDKTQKTKNVIDSTRISAGSEFSDGFALVGLEGDKEKTYCINEKGEIVFEVNKYIFDNEGNTNGDRVIGDFATISTSSAYKEKDIIDLNGKVTTPADVGATTFYDLKTTLGNGYIIADMVSGDYQGTVKKLGVMNTNFEWVVEPNESLYATFEKELEDSRSSNSNNFVKDDIYYYTDLGMGLNFKTGEVVTNVDFKVIAPSSSWYVAHNGSSGTYAGYCIPFTNEEAIDLSSKSNLVGASEFANNKACLVYKNDDLKKYYITMIDEQGNHLFEPVETDCSIVETDGEYIVASKRMNLSDETQYIETFNSKGEKLGQLDLTQYGSDLHYWAHIRDGVVVVNARNDAITITKHLYFDTSLKPLF